jgi:hypothetical protein
VVIDGTSVATLLLPCVVIGAVGVASTGDKIGDWTLNFTATIPGEYPDYVANVFMKVGASMSRDLLVVAHID